MPTEPTSLARLSMSLPADLFRQLDTMVEERGLPSRSQLIAELIRHALAEHEALIAAIAGVFASSLPKRRWITSRK